MSNPLFQLARDAANQAEIGLAPPGLTDAVDRVCRTAERAELRVVALIAERDALLARVIARPA